MIYHHIQKQGVSDTSFTLMKKLRDNYDFVKEGEIICSYESSKTSFDAEAEQDGYILFLHEVSSELNIGDLLYVISPDLHELQQFEEKRKSELNLNMALEKRVTGKAKFLMLENNLSPEIFKTNIITEQVVRDYLHSISPCETLKNFIDEDLVILGAGGHARQCYEILANDKIYNIRGFVDDNPLTKLYDLEYLGGFGKLNELRANGLQNVTIGIGFNGQLKKRDRLYNDLIANGFKIPTLKHKSSSLSHMGIISDSGVQIMAGAIIGPDAVISENVIINSGSIISHGCKIGKSSHITPGAILGGDVKIGERCTIGMGSTIYLGIEISDDKTVRNGESIIQ